MLDESKLPRYCIYRGRRCRVIDYLGNDKFVILDSDDTERVVHRSWIIFTK